MQRLPALFLGHGSPMNALGGNAYFDAWRALGERLPRPRAVLCVSAHWEAAGLRASAAPRPETIHDFRGFPAELFALRYPAPGSPELARRVADLLADEDVALDPERGLDHGAWAVLRALYPAADVPVVQLALDRGRDGPGHLALGRRLAPLRDEGVLILGSGNLVHNLGLADFGLRAGYGWAVRFDALVRERIAAGAHEALARYRELSPDAALAVPTPEHYLPLLYALGAGGAEGVPELLSTSIDLGSISMTSAVVG